MATVHPTLPHPSLLSAGSYRELDVLRTLEEGLPGGFDLFHQVEWSSTHRGQQQVGEVDVAVVSPGGHLLLVEVKAGDVQEHESGLRKKYTSEPEAKDIGAQLRRHHGGLLSRLKGAGLGVVRVATLLVLPDYRLSSEVLGHTPEAIVDAAHFGELCTRIRQLMPTGGLPVETRERLMDFLANRFELVLDVSSHVAQVQRQSTALAAGLATWVPAIEHPDGLYVVSATAGSGKTQLALALLRSAAAAKQRCAYVCFNRALADHMARVAPVTSEVMTFHELTADHARRTSGEPDFSHPGIHDELASRFLTDAGSMPARWDLLVLDETQDFKPEWAQSLLGLVKPQGRGYLLGDPQQQIYPREAFELKGAVQIQCRENFRSPRAVVQAINALKLTEHPVIPRSGHAGVTPGFHTYSHPDGAMDKVASAVAGLLAEGVQTEHLVLLSFSGISHSALLKHDAIAGVALKRFSGHYDRAGAPVWTQGKLLADTVYRFKGQSAPVVVFCEIDFEELCEKERRKLFVGMTRAQFRLECVISERSEKCLMRSLET